MVAGYSVHDELAALVRAGLSPFDAIGSATRDAGLYMGGDRFGVLMAGVRADLIMVSATPLHDVSRLQSPQRVRSAGYGSSKALGPGSNARKLMADGSWRHVTSRNRSGFGAV